MKLPTSILSLAFLTLILATICHALTFDVEPELFKSENLEQQSNGFGPLPNDRTMDLKQLYEELYKGLEKRAPAAGFYGMRGKKVPGQSFYGMRGKKAPSGFMGMRGKKMESKLFGEGSDESSLVPFPGLMSDRRGDEYFLNSKEMNNKEATANLKKLLTDNLASDDQHHDESKRAPSQGFMGLRGKRANKSM